MYWKWVWILFGIFAVANVTYLHRVPGLLGDEASEGENVYELLRAEKLVVQGERSYIGPLIDYVRVPFILVFGYAPLALRLVTVLVSCITFWLAAVVLRRLFGDVPTLFALAFGFFSPIYLTQQRLGWAITLMPFFTFLVLFFLTSESKNLARWLLVGVAAGLGLSNYILFFPTLAAIVVTWLLYALVQSMKKGVKWLGLSVIEAWPSLVGFWAGFATQFVILILFREDQGNPAATVQQFPDRLADLPQLLPLLISGSSYVARYTGAGFSPWLMWTITAAVTGLGILALIFSQRRGMVTLWVLGMAIHLAGITYMIDRFTLRYFFLFVFAAWILVGVGIGALFSLAFISTRFWLHYDLRNFTLKSPAPRAKSPKSVDLRSLLPTFLALILVLWSIFAVLIPFLKTGGSTADFSLGNRTDSAAALVDTRPLVECLQGAGPVSSENVHIWNRLMFLSHQHSDLKVISGDDLSHAKWLVYYRDEENPEPGELCPELAHFRIVAN